MKLKPFQLEFEKAVENDAYDTVVLSGPRSLGKTFMAAHNLTRSLEQARLTYGFIAAHLVMVDGNKDSGRSHRGEAGVVSQFDFAARRRSTWILSTK